MLLNEFQWGDKTVSGPIALVVFIVVLLSVGWTMWKDRRSGKRFDGYYAGMALFPLAVLAGFSITGFLFGGG